MRRIYDILAVLAAVALLAACGDEDTPRPEESEGVILFGGKSTAGITWINGRSSGSRAGEATEIPAVIPEDIGVFAFGNGQNTTYIFRNQRVYNIDNTEYKTALNPNGKFPWEHTAESLWPYTIDKTEAVSVQRPWDAMCYRFFAYSPWYPDEYVSVSAESYTQFSKFKWDNIPGFSSFDFVVANEIRDIDNTEKVKRTPDVVTFRMRHILSRIRFFFKMSPEYRKLRKIELNSLTVLTAGKVKTARFTFNNNTWDNNVQWTYEQVGDADPVTLTNIDNAHYIIEDLGKDTSGNEIWPDDPFANVYVYPQDKFDELKMELDYTVYDSKDVATRHSKVTNTISLSPAWTLRAGYYYDVKINIVPDFLYVLSDNDQDIDGYVIIHDN